MKQKRLGCHLDGHSLKTAFSLTSTAKIKRQHIEGKTLELRKFKFYRHQTITHTDAFVFQLTHVDADNKLETQTSGQHLQNKVPPGRQSCYVSPSVCSCSL